MKHGTDDDELVTFVEEGEGAGKPATGGGAPWLVLVVDDDEDVHQATRFALKGFSFHDRGVEIRSCYGEDEARAAFAGGGDPAIVLLDVVMERVDSGLRLVRHIRDDVRNDRVQIILRTGHPGDVPEEGVVKAYAINDYKLKTELTREKLFTCVTLALRAFGDITARSALQREVLETNARLRELNSSLESVVRARTADLERRQASLEASLRENRTLLRSLTHDLRNFMTSIALRCQLALDSSHEPTREEFDKVHSLIVRMNEFVGRIVAWEGLREGKLAPAPEPTPVARVLAEVVELFEKRLAEKGLSLEVSSGAREGAAVLVEPATFGVIVMNNLVSNALKFGTPGTRVEVRYTPYAGGGFGEFSVRDEGVGIPPALLEDIFSPAKRTTRPGTAGEKGVGFGLPLVKQYVTLMGGEIDVESRTADDVASLPSAEGAAGGGTRVPSGTVFRVRVRAAPVGK